MLIVWLTCWLLKLPLSLQARTRLTGAILERLGAVPLKSVIDMRDGSLYVEGKIVDYEKAIQLKASARAALGNNARKLVQEQIAAIAGHRGIVEGDTPEKLYFYRAALWWGLQEEELYRMLIGTEEVL